MAGIGISDPPNLEGILLRIPKNICNLKSQTIDIRTKYISTVRQMFAWHIFQSYPKTSQKHLFSHLYKWPVPLLLTPHHRVSLMCPISKEYFR